MHTEPSNATLVAASIRAEEIILADVDGYANWLADHCYRAPAQPQGYIPSDSVDRAILIQEATVPALVALMLCPFGRVVEAACWELRKRYLAAAAGRAARIDGDLQGA